MIDRSMLCLVSSIVESRKLLEMCDKLNCWIEWTPMKTRSNFRMYRFIYSSECREFFTAQSEDHQAEHSDVLICFHHRCLPSFPNCIWEWNCQKRFSLNIS